MWYLSRKTGKNILRMPENNKLPKKPSVASKWLIFTSIPFQMSATIYVFFRIGGWLDKKYLIYDDWGTKSVTLLGIFLAMYQVISQVNKLNKNG